jgi:hypothetical protein
MSKNTNKDGKDHHGITTTMDDNESKGGSTVSSMKHRHFPTAVHNMLSEAYETKNPAIEWIEKDSAFIVHPHDPQLAALILKFFDRTYLLLIVDGWMDGWMDGSVEREKDHESRLYCDQI